MPGVLVLALSHHHPGLFIVVPKYESTQSPAGWDKPHRQVRDKTGAQFCHRTPKPHTSCSTVKCHKCTMTQWLHLEAISVKSTEMT